MKKFTTLLICLCLTVAARAATINAASTSVAHVQAAIDAATAGDTVVIPAGSVTWSSTVSLNKAITLTGSGTLATTINTASGGPSWGTGVITISAAATLSNIAFGNANTASTCIDTRTTNGWRITGCSYTNTTSNGANTGYFIYANSYGLIDHCTANSTLNGSSEMIFIVGPTNSWQTADTMGTANAVYIEDCTFDDAGYVCDAHANSRAVARFNTINGSNKIDCHGLQSASPRGARHIEVYNNTFTYGGYVMFIELRSGTGRCFNNTATYDTNWLALVEYYVSQGGQTSAGYPFDDQVGVGIDPKSGGSAPFYMWGNRHGSSVKWLNERSPGGSDMTGTINPERDYFEELSGTFTGSAGVGIGTKAQMNAITPTTTGVGYWVTDEGSWRAGYAGTSGQLYRWSGSAWVLNYTPYTYPHPLQSGGGGDANAPANPRRLSVLVASPL